MSATPRSFYRERIPEQFNRALDEAHQAGGAESPLHRDLVAVDATIEARVEGAPGSPFYLNVRAGRMTAGDTPALEPVLVLVHDLDTFGALERASGDSALGFLGGLAGLGGEIKLTKQRLAKLRSVNGTVRFSLTGPQGFTLLAHFGGGEPANEPACAVSLDGDIYAQLRAGAIDVQEAFMSGKVDIEGDMQMAMQLALAIVATD